MTTTSYQCNGITVHLPAAGKRKPLLMQYPGQTNEQPAWIVLTEKGELYADYNPEIGNAVSAAMWHGRDRYYGCSPHLKRPDVVKLLRLVAPLAALVYAGLSIVWDGNNMVGRLSETAIAAEREIEITINEFQDFLR